VAGRGLPNSDDLSAENIKLEKEGSKRCYFKISPHKSKTDVDKVIPDHFFFV
jgi:hypothetical protein